MAGNGFGDDDALFWIGLILAGYFVIRGVRAVSASDAGGAVFEPSAPAGGAVTGGLEILVPLQVSPSGVTFIMGQEGFSATVRNDAGHRSYGFGHIILPGDPSAPITRAQGAALLDADLAKVVSAINSSVTKPLSQNQFDALASFVLNVGSAAFKSSTLLRKLNAGDYAGAAAQFQRWRLSQGAVTPNLVQRRALESDLFSSSAGSGSQYTGSGLQDLVYAGSQGADFGSQDTGSPGFGSPVAV